MTKDEAVKVVLGLGSDDGKDNNGLMISNFHSPERELLLEAVGQSLGDNKLVSGYLRLLEYKLREAHDSIDWLRRGMLVQENMIKALVDLESERLMREEP